MEHVSTFCALSTVGIAASGFALGRVDRDPPKTGRFRKKTSPLHDQCARATDGPLSPLSDALPPQLPHSIASPGTGTAHPPSRTPSSANRDGPLQENVPEAPPSRRKSSFAGIILRRRGQTLSIPPPRASEDASTPSQSRRPSSSWVRRLSFQPENRWSTQSPVSPSFNAEGSIIPRPASQRRPPNKLVKRPPSQPVNSPVFGSAPPSPSVPGLLRRPATSYQRSETQKHKATHSLTFEPSLVTNSPVTGSQSEYPLNNDVWQPYLKSSFDELSDRLLRRFSTATRPKDGGFRRIIPHVDSIPALVLSTSVSNMRPVTEASVDASVPISPVQFRDPFKPPGASFHPDNIHPPHHENEPPVPPQSVSPEEPEPKAPVANIVPIDTETIGDPSFSRPKRRAISTPLPNWPKSEGPILVPSRQHERRNITDPNVFRQPSALSHSEVPVSLVRGRMAPRQRLTPSYSRFDRETWPRPLSSDTAAMSSFHGSIRQRPKRHSIAASDPASTIIGSDDTRIFTSGEEDETDFLSDTAFDSIRTHFTANSSVGLRTPRIETIFDKGFPPGFGDDKPLTTGDLCSFESRPDRHDLYSRSGSNPMSVSLEPREESALHEDDSRISFPSDLTDEEDARSLVAALPSETNVYFGSCGRSNTSLQPHAPAERDLLFAYRRPEIPLDLKDSDSRSFATEAGDSCPKLNIFDWSEQPKNDRENNGPDGRPRTVHGKHGPESRGSRPPGRKAPTTLHLRSQSVPVSRESTVASETRQASGKFGTWGLGSKGVSEDWDSDFEFEDADESAIGENLKPNKSLPSRGMMVPQAIMERQASLHGQFGQVQELTLLVEELKRLRHQASFLGVVRGPSSELWKEAEGIVNLATLDDEDNDHSPPGSPSSLTFSFDDSEGDSSNLNDQRASGGSWNSEQFNPSPTTPGPDIKEDSSKPHSVLDLIYQQRASQDPALMSSHLARSKKLPFDTQSLRDLVVRAGVVTRALKEVVRKAEGVSDPEKKPPPSEPPFSRIFDQPSSSDNFPPIETRCIA
ncbi:hypothetical protein BDV59DRAFT_132748 [Aspergillus ambiguus]|uniref:uncharacterized protein n=1 Tax=Aspergillus ambiguus TaxID=176160 RepID=UPI003CCD8B99